MACPFSIHSIDSILAEPTHRLPNLVKLKPATVHIQPWQFIINPRQSTGKESYLYSVLFSQCMLPRTFGKIATEMLNDCLAEMHTSCLKTSAIRTIVLCFSFCTYISSISRLSFTKFCSVLINCNACNSLAVTYPSTEKYGDKI